MAPARIINDALRPVPPAVVYVLGAVPALLLFHALFTGGLGVDPLKRLEHALGLHALQFLIAGLCVTPLRRLTGISLLRFRRALGLVGFAYVVLHFAVWLGLDMQFRWGEIGKDILKRPYITIGMAGFALLIPLALTSTDSALRRMGAARWQRLHRLVYPAVLLGAAHYVMVVKSWPIEPILYFATVATLVAMRVGWHLARNRRRRPAAQDI